MNNSSPHVQARLLVLEQQLASLLKRSEEVHSIVFIIVYIYVLAQGLTPARTAAVQKYVIVLLW